MTNTTLSIIAGLLAVIAGVLIFTAIELVNFRTQFAHALAELKEQSKHLAERAAQRGPAGPVM